MSVIPRVLHGSSGSEDDVGGEAALFRSIDPPPRLGDPTSIAFGDTLRMHHKKTRTISRFRPPSCAGTLPDVPQVLQRATFERPSSDLATNDFRCSLGIL